MRKLMWFTVGFSVACVLSVYWLPVKWLILTGILMLCIGTALYLLRTKNWLRIGAFICFGLAVGQFWFSLYDAARLAPVRDLDGETTDIVLTAEDYSFDTDYGITVDGVAQVAGGRYRIRMYLNQKEPLFPGDRVSGTFRLRYTAPGGKEDPTHHSGSGVLFLAYPKGEHSITAANAASWKYIPAYLRHSILQLIDSMFPLDAVPFAKALLLGDTSQLDYETETNLSASGIRHVAAVSGLHVSILFSMVYLFSGRRRIFTVMLGIPTLFLFAAMAGFSPSILRASLMQLLMLLALLFQREYDSPTGLAFAVLTMLTINPLTVTAVGFQLSVASVAGIFLFYERIHMWMMEPKRLGKWKKTSKTIHKLSASIAISISAWITTTPLTVWYFGSVNLLSAITNLLCLWVVTILFCGIIAACILGAFWLPAGCVLAWVLGWLVRYILLVAKTVASIPFSVVYTVSAYHVAWLIFCYILLAVFLISKQKKPLILCCCAVLTLCMASLASWAEPLLDHYRVTVLDVGQGQCVLLQSNGKTYVVDCGGDRAEDAADLAAATLLSQGIDRIDGLILTHYDDDHVGGAGNLLYRLDADVVILPEGRGSQIWDDAVLKYHNAEVIRAEDDLTIGWADAQITVYSTWNRESSNESSLCVLFQTEKCAILITGDRSTIGEEILIQTAQIPQLDALVVGHHGAASSTGEALLAATKPKNALISVGENNGYNHPSQAVLDRLRKYGCAVHRTDLEGTILFRG